MSTTRRALLASLVLLAVGAPAASAATVEVGVVACAPKPGIPCPVVVDFDAAPGEANDLEVSTTPQGELRFRDSGAPITAGTGCRKFASDDAICPNGLVNVVLGDGDDAAAVEVAAGVLDGGAGNDRLTGSAANDVIWGGPGTDELHGGAGDDSLSDGDPAASADVFDGGPGADTVSYMVRRTAVKADLVRRTGGAGGENDQLIDLEGVLGGGGDDDLRGGPANDDLFGAGGRDRLYGRGGDDRLQGGRRTDRLSGGDGDDKLIGTVDSGEEIPRLKRGQDFFRCGEGHDIVERADLDDIVVSGCDGVEPEQGLFLLEHPLRPVQSPRRLSSPIVRIANAVYDDRRVVMRVREPRKGGRILGSTVVVRDGAGQKSVRLNALGRALLARRTSMRVGVEAFERGGDADEVARFRMIVRRPPGR